MVVVFIVMLWTFFFWQSSSGILLFELTQLAAMEHFSFYMNLIYLLTDVPPILHTYLEGFLSSYDATTYDDCSAVHPETLGHGLAGQGLVTLGPIISEASHDGVVHVQTHNQS